MTLKDLSEIAHALLRQPEVDPTKNNFLLICYIFTCIKNYFSNLEGKQKLV